MASVTDKYRSVQKRTEYYSDFSINLTAHPDTKDLVRVTNEETIKSSIRNLVLTDEYERPFQPSIKSNVKRSLFELPTAQTAEALRSAIEEVIETHEPRAKLVGVQVIADPDRHSHIVNIAFYTINNPTPISFTITLRRIR